ncbi:MAG: polysaccharide biosynthesis protein, partial [Firmicutes bacterium]|nr:polysaccharide biosynthesis protein [Bacillota bacterium]
MAEESKAKKTFVAGAALLGVAGVLVKVLGVFFRIPLTNIISAEGMGYYQTAYPMYILMLTVSSSGLPTAISRMIAERRSVGQYYEAYRVFKVSFKVMLGLGLATAVLVFVLAPWITTVQNEPDAVYALRTTVPALLLCPVMSCYRGYFQGQKQMAPTAISQVVEQVFRVGIGLALASLLMAKGKPHAAAGASFGASAGALFGLIAVLFMFVRNKPNMVAEIRESGRKPVQPVRGIVRDLLAIAIPITIGASIMPILNWIDTLIVKNVLVNIGYTDVAARTLYGELSGMASPIINVPQVLTQAICLSLVPVITDAFKRDDMAFVRKNSALGLRYAALVGLPC